MDVSVTSLDGLLQKLFFVALVGAAMWIEHKLIAKRWKRYERARWTVGVATVFALAMPLWWAGLFDGATLLWLLAGFGVAGAVTAGLYTNEAADVNEQAQKQISTQVE
jgi:hypothetical protein